MNKMLDIYINRKNKVSVEKLVETKDKEKSVIYVATILKNIEEYGYTFSEELIEALKNKSTEDLVKFYLDLKETIKLQVGEGIISQMKPMYPNFPKQVMEADYIELFINAMVHYISCGSILPEYKEEERFPLISSKDKKLTIIDLGTEEDFFNIYNELLSSKAVLSNHDKEDLVWFVDNMTKKQIVNLLPNEIVIKETLSFITPFIINKVGFNTKIANYYKTATDVLRLILVMNGYSSAIDSSEVKWLRPMKTRERKCLVQLLEGCSSIEADMFRNRTLWLKALNRLHPGNFKKCKKVNNAYDKLIKNKKIPTFKSKLEKMFEEGNVTEVVNLLSKRPGEFARALDRTVRLVKADDLKVQLDNRLNVVKAFDKVANLVSTPILLQLMSYFKKRSSENDVRVFFPKGNLAKAYVIDENIEVLEKKVCDTIVFVCQKHLRGLYSAKEMLGNVYIDYRLKDFVVPTSQRNASKSLKNVARGSKFKIAEDVNFIRAFVYWKNHDDIDLSAYFLTEDFKEIGTVAYYDMRNKGLNACHSGDIIDGANGASEYIDIDLESALNKKVKYVLVSVYNFSNKPFSDLEECFFGYMERTGVNDGKVFEPSTVKHRTDLSTKGDFNNSVIIDVENREIIICDLSSESAPYFPNNANTNKIGLINGLKGIINHSKPNMYDLAKLHADARGMNLVEDKLEADTLFLVDKEDMPVVNSSEDEIKEQTCITLYDVDYIISNLL